MNEKSTMDLHEKTEKRHRQYRLITIEPPLILFMFASTLSAPVLQNLVISRTCNTLGYNSTVCHDPTKFPSVEAQVQPHSALIFMAKSLIETILPAALSIFLGPWSDHHGRRPILYYPLLGHVVIFAGYVLFSSNIARAWDIHLVLLPSIAVALTGGFIAFLTGAFCYLSDVTQPEERAWRMGVAEAVLFTGLPMGLASSSYVFAWGGYMAVFGLSCLANFLGLIYVIFLLPESVNISKKDTNSGLQGLFDWRLISNMVKTCIKPRPGMRRTVIFFVMAILATSAFSVHGEMSIVFLYTRKQFHWTIKEFSLFSSLTMLVTAFGSLAGLYVLSTRWKLPDAALAAFALLTKTVSALILALADQPYLLFLGSAVGVLSGMAGPLGRTILSKSVPKEDIGKVFSLSSSLDALAPIAAAPVYTLIYNATLSHLAGAFFFLSASINVINVLLLSGVAVIHCKHPVNV